MEIRCKKTHRFLIEIEIEQYLSNLRKIGIKQELPLRITIPCPRCQKMLMKAQWQKRHKSRLNTVPDFIFFLKNKNSISTTTAG